mgnify:CR=1 FL=1|jgi:hypothetical protein
MKELLVKSSMLLAEATGDTKSAAEKINDFFAKPEMQATGWILLSVVVVAVVGYVVFRFAKKHIR